MKANPHLCNLCGKPVIDDGCRLGHYRLWVHFGRCCEVFFIIARDFNRSEHGRWRKPAEVKRLLKHRNSLTLPQDHPHAYG